MKLIFLDIDGVLNCAASFTRRGNSFPIDDDKVDLLAQIVEATGAEIVLSSTWRSDFDDDMNIIYKRSGAPKLVEKLKARGLKLFGRTPNLPTERGTEIKVWLLEHEDLNIESICILDDDVDMGKLGKFLVKTNWNLGLTPHCVEKAIKILNKEK